MNWNEFAELNEEFLDKTPTQMVNIVNNMNFGDDTKNVYKVLSKTYPNNGIGEKNLIKRLAEQAGVEEYTIEALVDIHGGLPEAIGEFWDNQSNEVTLEQVVNCLYAENRDDAYSSFTELSESMNGSELKWLIAFLIRQTRHGCSDSTVLKMLSKAYGFKATEVKKAGFFMSVEDLIEQIIDYGMLNYDAIAGNYMKPMLAKGGDFTVNSRKYCDYKYDGIRAQVHQNADGIKIFNRKGDDITNKYVNDLIPLIGRNADPVDWIVDGEIYPVDTEGNPADFKYMMSRIHGKTDDVIYRNEVTIRLFDCLSYGGQNVFDMNLDTRLQTLQMHFAPELLADTKEINSHGEMLEYYDEAIAAGFEGVIVKSPNLEYEFGKRSKGWMKYKPPMVDIDCIVTGANMGVGKRAGVYGSYDIAISDGDDLISFGSVGSGFTESELIFLTGIYDNKNDIPMIIEVKGDMITQNETGEYGLRFPRYVKFRDDKDRPTDKKELKI